MNFRKSLSAPQIKTRTCLTFPQPAVGWKGQLRGLGRLLGVWRREMEIRTKISQGQGLSRSPKETGIPSCVSRSEATLSANTHRSESLVGHRYFRVSGQESNVFHSWWMFRLAVQPSIKKPWSRFLGAKTCQLCQSGVQGLESWPLGCDAVAYKAGSGDITHTVAMNTERKTVFQIIALKREEIL